MTLVLKVYYGSEDALKKAEIGFIRAARQSGEKCFVLVPEMSTLEEEISILKGLNLSGSFDIQVMSPSRLSERVAENVPPPEAQAEPRVRIDAQGKAMAVAGALSKVKKELAYYESAAERRGFVDRASALIADFKRAGLMPQTLCTYAEGMEEGAPRDKFHDFSLLYGAYEQTLEGKFVDGEDVQADMLQRLESGSYVTGACVVAKGFDVVTGQFARTLCAAARTASQTHVLLRCDETEAAYRPVWESAQRLRELCEQENMECTIQKLEDVPRASAPDLLALRKAYLSGAPVYSQAPAAIRLYAGATPYFEMRFIATEILRLYESGIPYSDMSIAFCASENYAGVADSVLSRYGIPFYLARKLPAASHGAARFFLSSLRAASGGLQARDVADVLDSGYSPLADFDAWQMKNYIESYGIRGKLFLKPFARGDAQLCAALEESRKALAEPLLHLRQGLSEASCGHDALLCAYAYLEKTGVYQKLMENETLLMEKNMPAQAAQGRQMWKSLLSLMEQLHDLYGDKRLTPSQLTSFLEAGLSACELSALPPERECVLCGQLGKMSTGEIRVLFVAGLNDDALTAGDNKLMTDDERMALEKASKTYISLDADGQDDLSMLDFYHTLCRAGEKLYLTRAMAAQSGEAKRPHMYLSRLRRVMPLLCEEGGVRGSEKTESPLALFPTMEELPCRLRDGDAEGLWAQAWQYIGEKEPDRKKEILRAFEAPSATAPLPREITQRLFLERVMSITRLESFAVCPFKHFVQYGLSPVPKREWVINKMDAGVFYHSALEGFTRLVSTMQDWPKVSKKAVDEKMDAVSDALLEKQFGPLLESSRRAQMTGREYRRVLRHVAWVFTKGAQNSAFTTEGCEVRFGYGDENSLPAVELELPDGQRVALQGTIDRIDRYEGDEGVFLRVVDYKSGAARLNPTALFYGTQLQLMLYLLSALHSEENAEPAGAYYQHIADPIIPEPAKKAQIEEKLAKEMNLQGVTLRDAKIIGLMDSSSPRVALPELINKDGNFAAGKMVADLDNMHALIVHARDMAVKLCTDMCRGNIDKSPIGESDAELPCRYCDYSAICRKEENGSMRGMEKMNFDELLRRLNEPE